MKQPKSAGYKWGQQGDMRGDGQGGKLSAEDVFFLEKISRSIEMTLTNISEFDLGWFEGWMERVPDCPHDEKSVDGKSWLKGYLAGRNERIKMDKKEEL